LLTRNRAKAIQRGQFANALDDLIDAAISETDSPAINEILRKIKAHGPKNPN